VLSIGTSASVKRLQVGSLQRELALILQVVLIAPATFSTTTY
jgi:hypothetical protein